MGFWDYLSLGSKEEAWIDCPHCGGRLKVSSEFTNCICGYRFIFNSSKLESELLKRNTVQMCKEFKIFLAKALIKDANYSLLTPESERELAEVESESELDDFVFDLKLEPELEILVFAMFITIELYSLGKSLQQVQNTLDDFHDEMVNFVTNAIFLRRRSVEKEEEVLRFHEEFLRKTTLRYTQYRNPFREEMLGMLGQVPGTICRKTLGAFLDNLLGEKLDVEQKGHILVPFALKFGSQCAATATVIAEM